MSASSDWMIYGANGYTGELVAEEAVARGIRPVLAGRRREALAPLADRLGCELRVFDLSSPQELARNLGGVRALLLCAGPFSRTSRPALDACLAAGVHYLDITGEISVFEACHGRGDEAARAGCVVIPGVGFDVVPSDCLAASLARALPGATELTLAWYGAGSASKGTAKTMLEGIPKGGAIRKNGVITPVPLAWKTADIPFHDKTRRAVTIPWGDVSTAFHSTGIPNIEVYMAQPPSMIRAMKLVRPFRGLLGLDPVQRVLARRIDRRVQGPDAEVRASARSELWGRVRDGAGGEVEGTLTTPEGYRLTVLSSLASVTRLLAGGVAPGAHTPSSAFGADFITTIEGCTLRVPVRRAA
ncbi:MAG TPA: NAD(P)H-binding protein [Kofleriaceae bacterium]|nr:NAD(P)H-binding protein [Kofleriaceae bacterium]